MSILDFKVVQTCEMYVSLLYNVFHQISICLRESMN